MGRARRAVLRSFGRAQRLTAWVILGLSLVAFVTILLSIWKVPDPVTAGLASLALVYQGFQAVQEVENDLNSEASSQP